MGQTHDSPRTQTPGCVDRGDVEWALARLDTIRTSPLTHHEVAGVAATARERLRAALRAVPEPAPTGPFGAYPSRYEARRFVLECLIHRRGPQMLAGDVVVMPDGSTRNAQHLGIAVMRNLNALGPEDEEHRADYEFIEELRAGATCPWCAPDERCSFHNALALEPPVPLS